MKKFLAKRLTQDSLIRWVLVNFRSHPVAFVFSFFRSLWATKLLSGSFWPVVVRIAPGQKLKISKYKSSLCRVGGVLIVNQWGGNTLSSSITLGENSQLDVDGDFEIGPNVHISLSRNASLFLGGKSKSTGSGITCNSRLMVEKNISIGHDCIIAWDVFITDSDWHEIIGSNRIEPVVIGEKVWISHGASILKGSVIPNGSIVAAKSLVTAKFEIEKSLIAGIPAKIIKNNMEWNR